MGSARTVAERAATNRMRLIGSALVDRKNLAILAFWGGRTARHQHAAVDRLPSSDPAAAAERQRPGGKARGFDAEL
jgi:hypothetical protein